MIVSRWVQESGRICFTSPLVHRNYTYAELSELIKNRSRYLWRNSEAELLQNLLNGMREQYPEDCI